MGGSTNTVYKIREVVLVAGHEIVRELWDNKIHVQVSWIE
jgi:hypothetical protein